jgi:hypothetical protein
MKAGELGDLARRNVVPGSKPAQNGLKFAGLVYLSVNGWNSYAADS